MEIKGGAWENLPTKFFDTCFHVSREGPLISSCDEVFSDAFLQLRPQVVGNACHLLHSGKQVLVNDALIILPDAYHLLVDVQKNLQGLAAFLLASSHCKCFWFHKDTIFRHFKQTWIGVVVLENKQRWKRPPSEFSYHLERRIFIPSPGNENVARLLPGFSSSHLLVLEVLVVS